MRSAFCNICFLALGPALGLGIGRFAYGLLLPVMKQGLGWSYSQAGWVNTVNAIGYLIGAAIAASTSRKFGVKRTYIFGTIVAVVSVLSLGVTSNFILISLSRLISGISGAWIFVSGGVMAMDLAESRPDYRTVLIGIYYAGAGLGLSATGLLVPELLARIGEDQWQKAWLLLAGIGAIFAFTSTICLGNLATERKKPVQSCSSPRVHYRSILLGYGLYGAGTAVYMTFMAAYLKSSGQPSMHIGIFWVSIGSSAMTAPWLWSRLLSRSRNETAFSTLVGVTGLGAAVPLFSLSFGASICSGLVFGSAFFAVVAATSEMVRRQVERRHHVAAIGLFTLAFGSGQTLGPFCVGLLTDATGSLQHGLLLGIALIVTGASLPLFNALRRNPI